MFMNTRGICVYSYNGMEWNGMMESWNPGILESWNPGFLQCCVARNVWWRLRRL